MTGSSSNREPSLLEIACFDAESAIVACEAGADRIELCDQQHEGGTTPSIVTLRHVKERVNIPVFVMIRPRGGGFVYADTELAQMLDDIDAFKPLADGFVFGVLDAEDNVDVGATRRLVQRAHPLPCTFHRAFDEAKELGRGLEDVISTGCRAILSSGGRADARAGAVVLRDLGRQAGERIQLIPGGGVRAANIREILQVTGALVVHSSGICATASSVDPTEIQRMRDLILQDPKLDSTTEHAR